MQRRAGVPRGRDRRQGGARARRSSRSASPSDAAYFVLGGKAVAGIPDDGGYRSLSAMGPGDFFGEIAALTGSPRTANVVAEEETEVLEVPAATLKSAAWTSRR